MKKIYFIFFIFALLFVFTGCTEEETPVAPSNTSYYENLTINSTLTNEVESHAYHLYFVAKDSLTTDANTNDDIEKVGPIEPNSKGQYRVSMQLNWDLYNLIDSNGNELQAVIVESSDIYLLNPLNKKTIVEFVKNEDESTKDNYEYYAKDSSIDVSFTDAYPEGVYSLQYRDATFVIKLKFKQGYDSKGPSYQVGIMPTHNTSLSTVSMTTSPSKYYDTAFYEKDGLANWKGNIIVTDSNGEEVIYEGYPKKIEFDSNGKCKEGNIVTISIDN